MKYELTNIKEDYKGTTIYRIRALEDIRDDFEERRNQLKIKKGDLGGWVSGYHNLSQQGKSWIYDNSIVVDNARVEDEAIVLFNSIMEGNSTAYNRSVICNSYLNGNSMVLGSAKVNYSELHDDSKVMRDSYVSNSELYGNTQIRVLLSKIVGNTITNSIINEIADISNSYIYNSIIKVDSTIKDSDIQNCIISSTDIEDSNLLNVKTNKEECYSSTNIVSMNDINNIKSMLFYQCNLFPEDDYVIAYKLVNKNFSSIYDENFFYKVGEVIEEPNTDMNVSKACSSGLHFASPNYWIKEINRSGEKHFLLKGKIKLDDIVTIKQGKLRCKRAEILGYFEV